MRTVAECMDALANEIALFRERSLHVHDQLAAAAIVRLYALHVEPRDVALRVGSEYRYLPDFDDLAASVMNDYGVVEAHRKMARVLASVKWSTIPEIDPYVSNVEGVVAYANSFSATEFIDAIDEWRRTRVVFKGEPVNPEDLPRLLEELGAQLEGMKLL